MGVAQAADRAPAPAPIAVEHLGVRYGTKVAVSDLSFTVRSGEIYGLLGSNGAGKSSTIKSLVGLVRPSHGAIRIFGEDPFGDPVRVKSMLGYVPESTLLFDALTPREFLEYIASIRRLEPGVVNERVRDYARAFQVEAELENPLATLSNGTRQKIIVLAAFLHQPPLLILDEPLNNLDPRSVRIVKELLARYVAVEGRGVLFSTHTMEVAEQLCHRVGILDRGELKGEGTLAELRHHVTQGDPTLEAIFLRLTHEEEGVRNAVRTLTGG